MWIFDKIKSVFIKDVPEEITKKSKSSKNKKMGRPTSRVHPYHSTHAPIKPKKPVKRGKVQKFKVVKHSVWKRLFGRSK